MTGFRFPEGAETILFAAVSIPALECTQPPVQLISALSPGLKRPGREADFPPPSNAEVKNAWSYTSTLSYFYMAWCLRTKEALFFIWYW
jgi:hypothetical protein